MILQHHQPLLTQEDLDTSATVAGDMMEQGKKLDVANAAAGKRRRYQHQQQNKPDSNTPQPVMMQAAKLIEQQTSKPKGALSSNG
jgi:hypothetical protein